MFNNQLLSFRSRITFYLLISGLFLLVACENTNTGDRDKQPSAAFSQSQSFSSLLPQNQADSLIAYFLKDSVNMQENFLYKDEEDEKKVVAFRMDSLQHSSFYKKFAKLDSIAKNTTLIDSIRIRVSMALYRPEQLQDEDTTTNFVPIVQFLVNQNSLRYPAYPLKAFEPKLDWTSYNCKPDSLIPVLDSKYHEDQMISCQKTAKFLNQWLKLPIDSIDEQLYLNDPAKLGVNRYKLSNRVKYYTVPGNDVEQMYSHYQYLDSLGKPCYFYMYLGLLDAVDWVPLRTVIHLDDTDTRGDSTLSTSRATYFEFSRPCPKYCSLTDQD